VIRRRTCCVYCGQRIPGAVTPKEHNARGRAREPWFQLSARLTCAEHRELPLNDPAFEYEFSRA
jgi:hypothetical protein